MTKRAINLKEFNELTIFQQLDLLQKDGAYVGKRVVDNQTRVLYQIFGFYAEVHFREYRKSVERVLTSDDPAILLPYLDQIKIRDLDGGETN